MFQTLLTQPFFNLFVALYNLIPDAGVVIILVTLLLKLALYPLTSKSIKAQKSLTDLQPKLEELKKQYKDNQQALAQETLKLYKEHKVNPVGSCLPLLIQLPIFIALYQVLRSALAPNDFHLLYSFVHNPGTINSISFGFLDLAKPNVVLAVLAGAAQFWQTRMFNRRTPPKAAGEAGKDEGMMASMNKQMMYMLPVVTIIAGLQFPAGLALYWFLTTVLTALQQVLVFRSHNKNKKDDSDVIEGKIVS